MFLLPWNFGGAFSGWNLILTDMSILSLNYYLFSLNNTPGIEWRQVPAKTGLPKIPPFAISTLTPVRLNSLGAEKTLSLPVKVQICTGNSNV